MWTGRTVGLQTFASADDHEAVRSGVDDQPLRRNCGVVENSVNNPRILVEPAEDHLRRNRWYYRPQMNGRFEIVLAAKVQHLVLASFDIAGPAPEFTGIKTGRVEFRLRC